MTLVDDMRPTFCNRALAWIPIFASNLYSSWSRRPHGFLHIFFFVHDVASALDSRCSLIFLIATDSEAERSRILHLVLSSLFLSFLRSLRGVTFPPIDEGSNQNQPPSTAIVSFHSTKEN
jgi:hypothetical protein